MLCLRLPALSDCARAYVAEDAPAAIRTSTRPASASIIQESFSCWCWWWSRSWWRAAVWWKLKNAQLGNVVIHPEQKMVTKPVAVAKHEASAAPPSIAPPAVQSSIGQLNLNH